MSKIPAYERDPYLAELSVVIDRVDRDEHGDYALLDDTVLYPEGGGQPADTGWLGAARVVGVRQVEGEVRHYVDRAVACGEVASRLDWERRYDHMQQHTGQHLLTALADRRFGWRTTSFHLSTERCDIELEPRDETRAAPDEARLQELEEEVARQIRAALPITAGRVSANEYAALDVRSRGLPAGHTGDVRLVRIGDASECLDCNTCGGTHVRSTAEIEAIKLLGIEPMRGGWRLYWVAGGRVRSRLAASEKRNAGLRGLLGAADEDLVEATAATLEQLAWLSQRVKRTEQQLADLIADQLRVGDARVVEAHFDDVDGAFLQSVGRRFLSSPHAKLALLTASGGSGEVFMLAVGSDADCDLRSLGGEIAELFEGRGGGAHGIYQGKAATLLRRDAALQAMREATSASDGSEHAN